MGMEGIRSFESAPNYNFYSAAELNDTKSQAANFTGAGGVQNLERSPQEDTVSFAASAKDENGQKNSNTGWYVAAAALAVGITAFILTRGKAKPKSGSGVVSGGKTQMEKEAETLLNTETKHANSKSRKYVDDAIDNDIVTPEMQAAYDKEHAFQPLTKKQKRVKDRLDKKNAAERAEKNNVRNNSKGGEKLETVKNEAQNAETATSKIKDGAHVHPNGNTYIYKNGEVVKIIDKTTNRKAETIITDPVKIAKHLGKHNISPEAFIPKKNLRAAA